MRGLENLVSLQEVQLDFSMCNELTEESLKSISSSLQKLVCLRTVSLDFSWCIQITNEDLNNLKQSLKELPSKYEICIISFWKPELCVLQENFFQMKFSFVSFLKSFPYISLRKYP